MARLPRVPFDFPSAPEPKRVRVDSAQIHIWSSEKFFVNFRYSYSEVHGLQDCVWACHGCGAAFKLCATTAHVRQTLGIMEIGWHEGNQWAMGQPGQCPTCEIWWRQ